MVARKKLNRHSQSTADLALPVCHERTKSAPEALGSNVQPSVEPVCAPVQTQQSESIKNANVDPAFHSSLAPSQTWQATQQHVSPDKNLNNITKSMFYERSHSHSCDSLQNVEAKPYYQGPSSPSTRNVPLPIIRKPCKEVAVEDLAVNIKRNLQIDSMQLQQKCVTINKVLN